MTPVPVESQGRTKRATDDQAIVHASAHFGPGERPFTAIEIANLRFHINGVAAADEADRHLQ
jgi:hypothetical protein